MTIDPFHAAGWKCILRTIVDGSSGPLAYHRRLQPATARSSRRFLATSNDVARVWCFDQPTRIRSRYAKDPSLRRSQESVTRHLGRAVVLARLAIIWPKASVRRKELGHYAPCPSA